MLKQKMDFDELNCSPEIRKSWLYQQVVDQSDVCDVTLQVGEWRKRFHWCILAMSPYFECLRRNNFAEIQKGVIHLNVASPLDTETAIMYLYGKKPRLSEDNIASILELAEFFMIPNLKSLCVRYIRTIMITSGNWFQMLQLSCMYNIKITQCYQYMQRHMEDIIRSKEANCLSKKLVIEIFTDPHFAYVTAEKRFTFLTRWAKQCEANEAAFHEVFESISLLGMNKGFLEAEVLQNPLIQGRYDKTFLNEHCDCEGHKVLIFSNSSEEEQLACFDLYDRKWINLDIREPHDPDLFVMGIGTCRLNLPVVYKVDKCYGKCTVYMHTLRPKQNQTSVIDILAEDHSGSFSNYCVHGNTFAAVINKTECAKGQPTLDETDTTETGEGVTYSKPNDSQEENQDVFIRYSTLFIAKLESQFTRLLPVLIIQGTTISSCCLNSSNHVALFSEQQQTLFIYDEIRCQMNAIWIGQYIDIEDALSGGVLKLVPADRDFMLYNTKQAVVVSGSPGRRNNARFAINKVELEYDQHWDEIEYFYCDDTWFRFLRRSSVSDIEFAYVTHTQLLEGNGENLPWKELPITEEIGQISRGNQAFALRLHPSLLGNHLDCPQCEALKGTILTPITGSVEDDYNSDLYESSDDEYANDWCQESLSYTEVEFDGMVL